MSNEPVAVIPASRLKALIHAVENAEHEFELLHEMLDLCQIPRKINDEVLSPTHRLSHYIQMTRTYGDAIKAASRHGAN